MPSGAFEALLAGLVAGEPVDAVLSAAARDPGEPPRLTERGAIDAWFSAGSVAGVLENLDAATAHGSAVAAKAAAAIRTKSPTSLRITFEQMRRGGALDFEEAMRTEFRVVSRMVEEHDFYEGVRAAVIDKDGAARWRPAGLAEVSDAEVARHFAPLGADELRLP